ncbi:MAG: ATP-binding protein [Peptococcaceae bacterium]
MLKKVTANLWYYFVLYVFTIMLTATLIMAALAFVLIHHEVISFSGPGHPLIPIFMLLFTSVIVGTFISIFVGRKILKPITELSRATQAVAKGDFSVELDETYRVEEIREMVTNFNKMVQELDSIETFRNDFIVNVSHEFKTPLAAIEGYATLLQNKDLTEEEKADYAEMIIESARQLSTLSGNILIISKLENQEIVAQKSTFQLDEQIREALLLLETKWSEKDLELELNLRPLTYYGNEELLLQVWSNLFSNAIKFTPDKGMIMTTLTQSTEWVTIVISDNGIGMTAEVQKHIFEKFYQADKTRYSEGNGLGLTLVKRIIDLCGGKIQVQSEYGQGTTFVIRLPY